MQNQRTSLSELTQGFRVSGIWRHASWCVGPDVEEQFVVLSSSVGYPVAHWTF